MQYGNPDYLPLIFSTVFALIIFYAVMLRRRRRLMERFADKALIGEIAPTVSLGRKLAKIALMVTAFAMMLLSLARPQWGFQWEEIKRSGLDILIAIDVSKSMLAKDVKPNRLERSKFAVRDLVKKLNGDRVGLIAFAGTSFLQCPLTIDYDGFLLALDDLSLDTIPRGGTALSSAIQEAISIFKGPDQKYKVLVIITDGEELEGSAIRAADEAAKLGIKVYCVGVGTPEGELIPISYERGQRGYLEDRSGNVVKTRLNEELLKRIAVATGGSYVRASQADFGLLRLYDTGISKLEKRDIDSKMKKRYEERYQIFLAVALICLLLEPLIGDRRRLPHA